MSEGFKISLYALTVILILQVYALYRGIDGVVFGSAMAGIGGVTGYLIKHEIKRIREKRKK